MIATKNGAESVESAYHPRVKIIFTLCLSFLFIVFSLESDAKDLKKRVVKEKSTLEKIKRSIKSKKKKLSKLEKEEKSLFLTLETANTRIELNKNELLLYRAKLKTARQEGRKLEKSSHKIKKNIEKNQKLLSETLRRIYKKGRFSYLKLLFSAETFSDFLLKIRYAEKLSTLESEAIEKLKVQKSSLKVSQNTLSEKKKSIKVFIDTISLKQKSAKEEANKKKKLISSIKARKDVFKKHIKESKKAQKKLENLIGRLERNRKTSIRTNKKQARQKGLFSKRRGKLPWPIKGTLISSFGKSYDKKFKAKSFNNGIEIKAKQGDKVKAVYYGTIIFSDWFRGYGKLVVLDNGNGFYTLYGHLNKLLKKIGERVAAGDTVGLAGDTDSINGGALYFGIRTGGKPLNPLKWLR